MVEIVPKYDHILFCDYACFAHALSLFQLSTIYRCCSRSRHSCGYMIVIGLVLIVLARMLAVVVKPMYLQLPQFDLLLYLVAYFHSIHDLPRQGRRYRRLIKGRYIGIIMNLQRHIPCTLLSATDTVFVPHPAIASVIIITPRIAITEQKRFICILSLPIILIFINTFSIS